MPFQNIVEGVVNGIDFDARYSVNGMRGVAFFLVGWAQEEISESYTFDCIDPEAHPDNDDHSSACYLYNEPEMVDNTSQVRAVMVGDDREHIVDIEDLTLIGDDDYCPGCGAIPSCISNS